MTSSFPRYWPFVRGIHRSPVNFPHKGQWRGVLMFSLICAWINDWVNNREAGDLRRHRAHYDVTVMCCVCFCSMVIGSWFIEGFFISTYAVIIYGIHNARSWIFYMFTIILLSTKVPIYCTVREIAQNKDLDNQFPTFWSKFLDILESAKGQFLRLCWRNIYWKFLRLRMGQ